MDDDKIELEKLKEERETLEERNRVLAGIIEEISTSREGHRKKGNKMTEGEVKVEKAAAEGAEEPAAEPAGEPAPEAETPKKKAKAGAEEGGEPDTAGEGDAVGGSADNKKIESELSSLGEKLKGLEGLKGMNEQLGKLIEKMNTQAAAPVPAQMPQQPQGGQQAVAMMGQMPQASGPVGKGLASFGEEVDFESELIEIKNKIDGVTRDLKNLNNKSEYRLSRLEDEVKQLDKISNLEEGYEEINEKLTPENVQKLKKLIFSADELTDEVIPDLINKKLRVRVDPILNDMANLKSSLEVTETKLSQLRNELKLVEKFENRVTELDGDLRAEKDKFVKGLDDQKKDLTEDLENMKADIRRSLDKLSEEMTKIHTTSTQLVGDVVKDMFLELVQPKFDSVDKESIVFEERLKKLFDQNEKLKRKLDQLEAPENLKDWLDDKGSQIEKKLQIDVLAIVKDKLAIIEGVKRDIIEQEKDMKEVKERLMALDPVASDTEKHEELIKDARGRLEDLERVIRGIPKELETHASMLNKLVDTRDTLSNRLNSFSTDMRGLSEKVSSNKDRLVKNEQYLKSFEKSQKTVIDGVNKYMSALDNNLHNLETFGNNLSKNITDAENELKDDFTKLRAELNSSLDKRLTEFKSDLEKKRREDNDMQLREFKNEIKRISLMEEGFNVHEKNQHQAFAVITRDIKELNKRLESIRLPEAVVKHVNDKINDLNAKVSSETESLLKKIDAQSGEISALGDSYSDIKGLKEQIGRLPPISQKLDSLEQNIKIQGTEMGNLEERIEKEEAASDGFTKEIASMTAGMKEEVGKLKIQITSLLEKSLSDFRKEMESKRKQDFETQMVEFRNEINRISNVEQGINVYEKNQKKMIENFSDGLNALEGRIGKQMDQINGRINELASVTSALDDSIKGNRSKIEDVLNKTLEDKKELRLKLDAQKGRISDLLRELRK
jgi:chromosome segregation ATPase